jgi:hypothetical protein
MKRSRFTEGQIIGVLKEHEAGVRPDLHPATGSDAAQPAKLRASPRCPTRPNRQNSSPESRSRWIKVGGNVSAF